MNDLDRLRRQAEDMFGKETVDRFEREVRQELQEEDEVKQRELVRVGKATFKSPTLNNIVNKLQGEASNTSDEPQMEENSKSEPQNEQNRKAATQGSTALPTTALGIVSPKPSKSSLPKPHSSKVSGGSSSERLLGLAIQREYLYGMLGLVLGLTSILGGVILGLNGVAGSTAWTAKLLALESSINDAAPGVVLFIVGLFMIWATKPKIKIDELKDE